MVRLLVGDEMWCVREELVPFPFGGGEVYKDIADTRNASQGDHNLRGHN